MSSKIIGMLPASGSATRLNGLPKFLFPVNDKTSLLEWHVNKMLQCCDEVRISTRLKWKPLIEDLNLNATVYYKEPSTMADALFSMCDSSDDTILVGMPDVYIFDNAKNFYDEMLMSQGDVVLATWDYLSKRMKGQVGQVLVDEESKVLSVIDKDPDCEYPLMWGAVMFRNGLQRIDLNGGSILKDINNWIQDGVNVRSVKMPGQYIDNGTFDGLSTMYYKIKMSSTYGTKEGTN